ncbi:DUF2076 domain-containing protein [Azospirillum sp. RWY-5-1]|uniref:DUF2076 domain-containing protein n=1 Tax=Azospirillum oleiclasticum TaxID=2735135 RepID=A0ABX2T3Q1_9PROT|nr:DUF2076 domain-containing protein [Azospirillum oleiclasticum]NYZ11784.1 DUF2076 domain-containing protein [Azospirillum oleiclasticum]NYZ18944.1 DUF2076 domain-containing protein [Azospirillum oleiclasticum]
MTPEERTLLTDLFERLRQAETGPRDADAERLIRDSIQAQPGAPYYLAQTVLVQQHALTAAQARIEELERQLRDAAPAPQGGGSFLGGLLGGGRSPWGGGAARPAAPPPQPAPQPQRGPWGAPSGGYGPQGYGVPPYAPAPVAYAPPRGGGFLSGAMQTAAGVAGGMLAASAISSLLHDSPGPFGEALAAEPAHHTADPGAHPTADDPAQDDAGYQEADYQTDDVPDDAGGDSGGDGWI